MIKRLFILLIGLVFIFDSFADEQSFRTKFESKNGEYSVKFHKNKWELVNKKGSVKYKFKDQRFTSMTMFVSNNGQNIVVIDNDMEGHEIGERNAIWLYRKGILVKSYKLTELINDTCNVAKTIWHTLWSYGNFDFADNQSHFSFTTFELSEIVLDLTTGQIISNKKPDGYNSECIIVFGEFRKGTENFATMKILKYITGKTQKDNKVTFKTTRYGAGLWRELLMIQNGTDITPDKYRGNMLLNTCLNE